MPARLRMPAVTIGVAAVMAPLLSLATPAQAAGDHGGGPASAPRPAPYLIDSTTFAGYQAFLHQVSVTASARFRIPALSCTSAYRGIAPVAGVDVGVLYSSAFVFTACRHGKAELFPAVVINGNETNYPHTRLHTGDLIQVSTKVTPARTTVSVTDLTTGVKKKRTGPTDSTPNGAYVGDSQLVVKGQELRVPRFGTLAFTNCSINGKPLAHWHPAKYQRTLDTVVQITAGGLRAGGTAFQTHFKHS